MTTALALYQPPALVRPSGITSGDGADLVAQAWGRFGTSAQTQVDAQVQRQADVALDRVMARVPALAAQVSATAADAIERGRVAATRAAHDAAADALRQAAATLVRAEPWLGAEAERIAGRAGGRAADSGLSTIATQLAPYAVGALLVGVAVYLATEPRGGR